MQVCCFPIGVWNPSKRQHGLVLPVRGLPLPCWGSHCGPGPTLEKKREIQINISRKRILCIDILLTHLYKLYPTDFAISKFLDYSILQGVTRNCTYYYMDNKKWTSKSVYFACLIINIATCEFLPKFLFERNVRCVSYLCYHLINLFIQISYFKCSLYIIK